MHLTASYSNVLQRQQQHIQGFRLWKFKNTFRFDALISEKEKTY